jgi:membrane protein required for beta-lactamase induction
MKLILIVIAFFSEQHLGALERWRDWIWIQHLADRMHAAFGQRSRWSGSAGVLATLAVPLLPTIFLLAYFHQHFWLLWAIAQLVALLYSMGPHDLLNLVDRYLKALRDGSGAELGSLGAELTGKAELSEGQRPQAVMEGVFSGCNQRLFALYFWFVLLGGGGALLVRGLSELKTPSTARTLGFAHGAERLHALMLWIPTRLFAMGFALAGSLTHTFDRWSFGQTLHADENDNLIKAAGLGALQFDRGEQALSAEEEANWVEQARGLVGRTFLVWLSVLGLLSLRGWLG